MISAIQDIKSQGLNQHRRYTAIVVDTADPEFLGRVKVRVQGLFDAVEDKDLPWSKPDQGWHTDGNTATSGNFNVPRVGSRVSVAFQDGCPMHPVYSGYVGDSSTVLEEAKYNYPDRTVTKMSNGTTVVVDQKDNSVFIKIEGVLNLYVTGDLKLVVNGDVEETVKGNRTTYVSGNDTLLAGGNITRSASTISDQPISPPSAPDIHEWPGISGGPS